MRRVLLVATAICLTFCSSADAEVLPPESIAVKHSRGTVIGIHGGAWLLTGSPKLMAMPRTALARWRRAGWSSVNVDYRPGRAALADVRAAVRRARRGGRSVCLYGESAGGHLALLVATQVEVDCVETIGAPTDLPSLPDGDVRHAAEVAFEGELSRYSPARRSSSTPVLMAHATNDQVVPFAQRALPTWSQVMMLRMTPGSTFLVHSDVSRESLRALSTAERALRARVSS